jgi:uncharacterized protein (DUF302 family)
MRRLAGLAAAALALPALAFAGEEAAFRPFDGSFEDAAFAVESAIVGRGLVIDHVSHVGEMLSRTGPDVGSTTQLFGQADVFQFCSAVVSRRVMEADPLNIVHCPYGVVVAEREGQVTVGHRRYPAGPMQEVEALLDAIVTEAVGE